MKKANLKRGSLFWLAGLGFKVQRVQKVLKVLKVLKVQRVQAAASPPFLLGDAVKWLFSHQLLL